VGRCGKPSAAEAQIERFCRKVARHAAFFEQIRDEGGDVRLWVSSHSRLNYVFDLTPICIGLLATAGIALVIDVYGYPQNF
jgi:hypothetical protein